MGVILNHPSHPSALTDPRHQAVEEDAIDALASKLANIDPADFEPAHLLALRGELPANTCAACGEPTVLHFDTSGCLFVGCDAVQARRVLMAMVSRPMRELVVYGDQHPKVSSAIRDTLRTACGPAMSLFFDSLGWEDRIAISRRLAEVAVIGYLTEQAGK